VKQRESPCGRLFGAALVVLLLSLPAAAAERSTEGELEREAQLRAIQTEIEKLQRELAGLEDQERGVLGELERLGAALRLREAELREVALRLEHVRQEIEDRNTNLESLEQAQGERRRYLEFRLRELYKAGPDQVLRRLVGGDRAEQYWGGLRYASFLSERDARVLGRYRDDATRLEQERGELQATETELSAVSDELGQARNRVQASRDERSRVLRSIREDQNKRRVAIGELEAAAEELTDLVDSLQPPAEPALDIRKFKGLLDWPAAGEVTEGFGTAVHPRFKTRVPHPGLDIGAESGSDIRSVFEGEVVFASWMRGYGLTAIVDHGGGLMSIYAHASVLLVEPGEACRKGQRIGKVGDSGSLKGPFLYFELRIDGKPTDPVEWLRDR